MVETLILVSQSSLFFSSHIRLTKASLNSPSNRFRIQNQNQNPIFIANRRRRRSQARPQSSTRLLLNLASLVASNLKLLPPPLDLVLQEIGGGDGTFGGGGTGFWKGFGWEGFDGWRRRRKKKSSHLWVYGFAAICVLGLLFGREIESNAIWWGLGFGPFGIAAIRWWETIDGVQGWVFLGFCVWSFVVGMSFRREELKKWVSKVRDSIPLTKPTRKRKNRRLF